MPEPALAASVVEEIRRTRRHPRLTQFDYLHVNELVRDLSEAIARLDDDVHDVLDVYCGSRPYDDLLPAGVKITGLDIDNRFGVADVVTQEFLPFPDESFDVVLCTQAFYYLEDPSRAVAEIGRVLRPGGAVVITVPVVWEYDTGTLEHRFTEPSLRRLFDGWLDVRVVESGGWGVSWAAVTGSLFNRVEERLVARRVLRAVFRPAFATLYVCINLAGRALEAVDRRLVRGPLRLPMNLLVSARRPDRGS
jgi:SAM-dependent methyltransferase